MREFTAAIIGGLIYSAAFAGYFMLFQSEIGCLGRKFIIRNRLTAARKRYRDEGVLRKHLNQVLQATFHSNISGTAFLLLCGLLFFSVSVVAMRSMTAPAALSTALVTSLVPYSALRIQLEIIRKKSSFEGEAFVGNFLSAYRMAGYNIFEAMEKSGKEKQNTKNCSEIMAKILLEIRNTANHKDISRVSDKFAYVLNTNWSRMFAYNIKLAILNGTNISLALEDILIQLREARARGEERKRINAEAARIVKFFIPALYLLSIFMAIKHVGVSPEKFLYNQIFTPQGFMMFTAAALLFVLNLALIEFVDQQRFDY